MLASTPGNIIAQEDLTLLAQESTESGDFGAASEGSEFTDPVPASVPEVPAASEEPAAAADSPADFSDSGSSETAGTDAAAQAAAVDSSAEAAAIQPETAAAVSSEQGGYTDSAEPASLPGMEDEIAVDSDSSEGFVEENLTERTLDVQMYTQRLYEQQNVPTHELKTVNELWQWLFARERKPPLAYTVCWYPPPAFESRSDPNPAVLRVFRTRQEYLLWIASVRGDPNKHSPHFQNTPECSYSGRRPYPGGH
jgi:hypothetical protein